ncbi:alpha/beta hydrolase [Actinopolymorpha pittospori]|uniref:Pimeloyl-ACP methyl ester carboxylesterase n=1 Tax=Actinopolymorpha pittospori TaxID=648752 RepID=A0A927MRA0_9ACTN|nr:alpha/beta hydrolase [Actinopolymorpha pittospori]MBE1603773.1 pimeloyl-ACP methyl ester carboxylesterase [Actinopolymorpha pittospori]
MTLHVDVDGLKLAVEITGEGHPPVVFVTGLNDDRHVWDALLSTLTAQTMTVAYDRPDLGDSDPLPQGEARVSRSYGDAAHQLHTLLDLAGVPAPRVFVGHSIGGLIIHVYAAQTPADVAGLVYVDATEPQLYVDVSGFGPTVTDNDLGMTFDWRLGLEEFQRVSTPQVPAVVVASSVGRWATAQSPEKYAPYTMAQVDERWQRWQRGLAASLRAPLLLAHHARHYVHTEAPMLVGRAVDAVVRAVRDADAVQLDPTDVDAAGGTFHLTVARQ